MGCFIATCFPGGSSRPTTDLSVAGKVVIMAKSVHMGEKVCLNHPDVSAISRCTSCFKPICRSCIVMRKGMDFCSDLCAAKHFATSQSMDSFDAKNAASKRKRLFFNILKLIVLAGIIGGAYYCYAQNLYGTKAFIDGLIGRGG